DGKTVAFSREGSEGLSDVYLAPIAGGEPQRLTFEKAHIFHPTWMPDGHNILFASEISNSGLWKVPAGGGKPVQVEADGEEPGGIGTSRPGGRRGWGERGVVSRIWQGEIRGGRVPAA